MNNITLAKHITLFATNLDNSVTDEDKRFSVAYLAQEVGIAAANHVARAFGLRREYYWVNSETLRLASERDTVGGIK